MKKSQKILFLVSSVLLVLSGISVVISYISTISIFDDPSYCIMNIVATIIQIVGYALIIYSCLMSKYKLLCIGYFGVCNILSQFVFMIRDVIILDHSFMQAVGGNLRVIIVNAMIGFAFLMFFIKEPIPKPVAPKPVETNNQNSNISTDITEKVERLNKINSLLEMGAITQEEFDEKKKQILG